jgi:hypothetical protein
MGQPKSTAAAANRGQLDGTALVAHLVAELHGIECTAKDIFEHLKGILRWSEAEARELVDRAVAGQYLVRGPADDSGYKVGKEYDPEKNPLELKAAKRAASRVRRVPPIDRAQQRREMILAELSPRVPRTTESLWNALEPEFGYRRKLERDLADLKKAGLIARSEEGWLDCREQDIQVEQATVTALGLMLSLYDDIVPYELQERLRDHLEKAKRRLEVLPSNDPGVRWLKALRITPPRHDLDRPIVDPDAKDVIEEAILKNQKVHLRWRTFDSEKGETEHAYDVSISHLLLEVPAYQRIDVWSNGGLKRIALSEITEARLLEQRAEYPPDYEPNPFPPMITMQFGDAKLHDGKTLVTLDMSRSAYATLKQKKLGSLFSEPVEMEDGWLTVTLRAALDLPTHTYLANLKDVAIIGPKFFRFFATGALEASRRRYLATAKAAGECYKNEELYNKELYDEAGD